MWEITCKTSPSLSLLLTPFLIFQRRSIHFGELAKFSGKARPYSSSLHQAHTATDLPCIKAFEKVLKLRNLLCSQFPYHFVETLKESKNGTLWFFSFFFMGKLFRLPQLFLMFILKFPSLFDDFEPRYSYRIYSYK